MSLILVDIVAEAVRDDGRWVCVGVGSNDVWVVISRSGTAAWIFYLDPDMALARFFEHANVHPFSAHIPDNTRLVVHKPSLFRLPSMEAWKRIGGED
jgi:hypothetical protein